MLLTFSQTVVDNTPNYFGYRSILPDSARAARGTAAFARVARDN